MGCNIFNLGFFPCYVAWPLIFKPLMGSGGSKAKTVAGAVLGAVAALQAGAFSVVLQTLLSGRTELPFSGFLLLMQPIHLAIGLVEGLVTAAVVLFLLEHRPETLQTAGADTPSPTLRRRGATVIALTLLTGLVFSSFASADPDGLEWSMLHASGLESLEAVGPLYEMSARIQSATALLPDYSFKQASEAAVGPLDGGTAFSGLVGGMVTLALLSVSALVIRGAGSHRRREPR